MFWRWDCRLERARWAEGESGVRRAREPDCVVRRTGAAVDGAAEGWELGGRGRRVMVEG